MPQTAYLDFELEIGDGAAGRYPVSLLHSPAGEARGELILPQQPFATTGGFFNIPRPAAQTFGAALFNALLSREIRECYAVSQQMAAQADKGLRLKLRITPTALLAVPWELLYDVRADEFVCLTRQTPLVRYLTVAQAIQPLAIQPPLRILGLVASPQGQPALDVAGEKARLTGALAPLQRAGRVELTWIEGQTWRALQGALQNGVWHVFHYVGHAEFDQEQEEGALLLADEQGEVARLHARELARLLTDQGLRLTVLNTCAGAQSGASGHFSSLAGRLVRRGLLAVIAMQSAITDEAALEFSPSFYGALANGLPVDAALSASLKAISLDQPETLEWAIPVLYLRAPDGVLWQANQPTEAGMAKAKGTTTYHINTGGGQVIQGDVNTGGGDFVGRNKTTYGDDVRGHKVGGNLTVTTIGNNAKNVAVGSGISQTVNEGGAPVANDRQVIEQQLALLQGELSALHGKVDAGKLMVAEFQMKLLQGELTKTADQTPSASTITQIGDWLLDNLPEIAGTVTGLFTTAAVGRVIQKAGQSAVGWVKRRIG